jgi:hypothetical protein
MIEYLLEQKTNPIEVEKQSLAIRLAAQLDEVEIQSNLEHLVNLRKRMPDYLFAA